MTLHILGLGPAGVLAACRALQRGASVVAYDPQGLHAWPATYGVFGPEIPAWTEGLWGPAHPLAARTSRGTYRVDWDYRFLNPEAAARMREELAASPAFTVHERAARPGEHAAADAVLLCTGAPRLEADTSPLRADALWQLALGVVGDAGVDTPLFMDWSVPAGAEAGAGVGSFCYTQPLPSGSWLWEETILATDRSPAEVWECVEQRLRARLAGEAAESGSGGDTEGFAVDERVVIPMGVRSHPWYAAEEVDGVPVWAVGAAGGLTHPATGYTLGPTCQVIDEVLDAVVAGERRMPVLRRWNAELAYVLRMVGAELIARADQATLADFFGHFFALPPQRQWAYVSGHSGVGVAATMWALRAHTGLRHPFLTPLLSASGPRLLRRVFRRRNRGREAARGLLR